VAEVLAFVDDLFFQAKIAETARQLKIELCTCSTSGALLADLNSRSEALESIVQMRKAAPEIPVVAFLSHVQTELAEKARAAGCREVVPRSIFTRDLATILARVKSEPS
jgi:DNA-binding NarL/FixJ family response regulator